MVKLLSVCFGVFSSDDMSKVKSAVPAVSRYHKLKKTFPENVSGYIMFENQAIFKIISQGNVSASVHDLKKLKSLVTLEINDALKNDDDHNQLE